MYKYVLHSVVKIPVMFAKYFEYYTIIIRGPFFRGHAVHPFNSLFSRTTWVSRHQKINHSGLYWSKRWWAGSGISRTICKSFAPRSRQTTTQFLQDGCPSCHPSNSVKALKAFSQHRKQTIKCTFKLSLQLYCAWGSSVVTVSWHTLILVGCTTRQLAPAIIGLYIWHF